MKPYLLPLLSFLAIVAHATAQIRVAGTDLLADSLGASLRQYAENREMPLELDLTGSYRAGAGLQAGNIDLALLAIPLGHEVPEEPFRSVVIAHKVVAVAVPPANPLTQISLPQLAAVFGDAEATNLTRWGQLGLTEEWGSRSIAAISVPASSHSLTLDLFRNTVMRGPTFKRGVTYFESVDRIRNRLQQDNSTIGLLPTIPENQTGMKLLALSTGDGGLAHEATPESVATGQYPVRLPIYASFHVERGADLGGILGFLVTDEAAEAIRAAGLMPLPTADRGSLALEFERL